MGVRYNPGVVTDSLVLCYDAGDKTSYTSSLQSAALTTWSDLSGNGNNGTLTDGPTFDTGSGGSIVFDGSNDYVNTNSTFQSTFQDSFSISEWVRMVDGQGAEHTIIGTGEGDDADYMYIQSRSEGYLKVQYAADGDAIAGLTGVVFPNGDTGWIHIVVVIDKSVGSHGQIYAYANGVLQTLGSGANGGDLSTNSTVMADYVNPHKVYIGALNFNGSDAQNTDGKIPIVQIYNRALTSREVLQNFNAQRGRFGV